MADLRCLICGLIMQTHEKASGEFTFLYNRLPSVVAFRVRPQDLEYVPGTIRHAKCEGEIRQ